MRKNDNYFKVSLEENIKNEEWFPTLYKALFKFQEHNGLTKQKYINDYTAKCLNESTYNKVIRACYALERYRWQIKRPKKDQ